MGTFEKLGLKQVVKTTEETITIDNNNQTFRLLYDNDLAPYRDIYRFMHIGLVQVAFKPLTLRGLLESFIVALRDENNFDKSKVVTRRPIKWEEIDFPQEWVIENATQPQNNINTKVSEIEQLNDGTIKIRFHEPTNMLIDNHSMSSRMSRSNSSYISPVDYIVQME
ncbi:hypothetical protein H5410_045866 [Solanum commersonii]|uniref:Uncharacterized protein n=1 Tax=Solanum commersonii TaxID=4109 RepID=A0A9J5XEW4_SOLCO|nr:hypothetical protein H5410_045866 [Solanum commersonii]